MKKHEHHKYKFLTFYNQFGNKICEKTPKKCSKFSFCWSITVFDLNLKTGHASSHSDVAKAFRHFICLK